MSKVFCPTTKLWLYQSKATDAHIGAWLLKKRRLFKKKPALRYFHLHALFGLFLFFFVGLGLQVFIPTTRPLFGVSSLLFVTLMLSPLLILQGVQRRQHFFNRFFHFDSFLGLVGLTLCIFPLAQDGFSFTSLLDQQNLLYWNTISLLLLVCCLLRAKEAELLHKRLKTKKTFLEDFEENFSSSNSASVEAKERALIYFGIVFVSIIAGCTSLFIYDGNLLWSGALVALLPFCIPSFQWFISRSFLGLLREGVITDKLEHLEEIRGTECIHSHQSGVWTDPQLKLSEHWIDPSFAWKEQEVSNLIGNLAALSEHPACLAIQDKFQTSGEFNLELSDVQHEPFIGLITNFRDEQGKPLDILLGNITWMDLERHSRSPEAVNLVSQWQQKGLWVSALSINHRIVAIFGLQTELKPDAIQLLDSIKELKKKLAMMSSAPAVNLKLYEEDCHATAFGLVPIERAVRKRHWQARSGDYIELISDWDQLPDDEGHWKLIFCRQYPKKRSSKSVYLMGSGLGALQLILDGFFDWTRSTRYTLALSLSSATLIALWLEPVGGLVLFVLSYGLSLIGLKAIN